MQGKAVLPCFGSVDQEIKDDEANERNGSCGQNIGK